jgi:hypothetical protein
VQDNRVLFGDVQLAVLVAGDGKPVLLIHGLPDDHGARRKQIRGRVPAGYAPFAFDIEHALRPGVNRIIFRVADSLSWTQPRGKQAGTTRWPIDYDGVTGIWQTVWLEPLPAFQQMLRFWADRQVKGMDLICGSFEILDDSLHRFLTITEHLFTNGMFIFGSRPSRAEIAIYGILSQLIIDPAPAALMREKFNMTYRWMTLMEDLSGVEGEWEPVSTDADRFRNARILDLLELSGTYHLPLLAANAKALENGEKRFSFDVEGQPYTRKAHNRHAGCLEALRKRYSNL